MPLVIARGVGQVRDVLGTSAPDEFSTVREAVAAVRADWPDSRTGQADGSADSKENLMGGAT